jgi:hypothetical protein
MHPKAEEFILDVRRAVRTEQKPVVMTDSHLIDAQPTSRMFERVAHWLTPKVVEEYDPTAFVTWTEDLQQELRDTVDRFRTAANQLAPGKPRTTEPLRAGLQAFEQLKTVVQKVVWAEWEPAAKWLLDSIETWSKDFGWAPRRQPKQLEETLLGKYALDSLYFHAEGNLYFLDPLARFVPGGIGAFDLSIQPSYLITSTYRNLDGAWLFHLDVGQGTNGGHKVPVKAESFRQAVAELRSLL